MSTKRLSYCDCARYCKNRKQVSASTFYAHAPYRHTVTETFSNFASGRNLLPNNHEENFAERVLGIQPSRSEYVIADRVDERHGPKRRRLGGDGMMAEREQEEHIEENLVSITFF